MHRKVKKQKNKKKTTKLHSHLSFGKQVHTGKKPNPNGQETTRIQNENLESYHKTMKEIIYLTFSSECLDSCQNCAQLLPIF